MESSLFFCCENVSFKNDVSLDTLRKEDRNQEIVTIAGFAIKWISRAERENLENMEEVMKWHSSSEIYSLSKGIQWIAVLFQELFQI